MIEALDIINGKSKSVNDNDESVLGVSLIRYLKYLIGRELQEAFQVKELKILLVVLDDDFQLEMFFDKKNEMKDIKGILFLNFENHPRGDIVNSKYNESRILWEFFENSFNAVTANHRNVFSQLPILIYKILKPNKNEQQFESILSTLEELIKRVIAIDNGKKTTKNISKEEIKGKLNELSISYPFGGIHTQGGHRYFRKFIKELKEIERNKVSDIAFKIFKIGKYYDLASIVANNPLRYDPFKILVIDDNPGITGDLKNILKFFPKDTEIYVTENGEWRRFLNDKSFWNDMYNQEAKLSLIKLPNGEGEKKDIKSDAEDLLFEKKGTKEYKEFKFQFIVVDLLFDHYNEGNQIINNLVNFRDIFNRIKKREEKAYFDIIVLSLSEEANDISRALNEGGLCYVPKKRIYMLPAVIAQLEKSRQIIEKRSAQFKMTQKSRNFAKLYRLPEIVKLGLQCEPFLDLLSTEDFKGKNLKVNENALIHFNKYLKIPAKEWIQEMPKADIHCHLGGSIPGEIAFYLSLNMLIPPDDIVENRYKNYLSELVSLIDKFFKLLKLILFNDNDLSKIKHFFIIFKILLKIVLKFDLDKSNCIDHKITIIVKSLEEEKVQLKPEEKGKKEIYGLVIDYVQSHLKWISNIIECCEGYFFVSNIREKAFEKIPAEKTFIEILEHIIIKRNYKDIPAFQSVNIFNVFIGIIEGKTSVDIGTFWAKLMNLMKMSYQYDQFRNFKSDALDFRFLNKMLERNIILFEFLKSQFMPYTYIPKNDGEEILTHFISAKKRQSQSLADFLGGKEFIGAEQLQKKENIAAALYSIIEQRVNDNVRLLELKASPDGYTRLELTLQEAVQTMLLATDLITLYFYDQGKFIRVNYIFTIKRHKRPKEAALEVSAAVVNREREKIYQDISPEIKKENVNILKYEWKPSKVVGIDLAGLEKGNPAKNFVSDFYPLFKTSSFITVHAGEEDTAQSIWEAVYLLHANRIGHGLTLNEDLELKDLFKNIQICIEMNPISNTLTNPNIDDRYPFFEFFKEGLNITINTDDPAISESTLSEEFVKAAELFQKHRENKSELPGKTNTNWISKWEILRIIKNAFSSSFLDREEKRRLIRAVEEEIYQIIIDKSGC